MAERSVINAEGFPLESQGRSLLSTPDILRHIQEGNIVIDPYVRENIKTGSVDLTLGENYFSPHPERVKFYNPWNEKIVRTFWGEPEIAPLVKDLKDVGELVEIYGEEFFDGLIDSDRIVVFKPGEMKLCHTNEYVGGRHKVTTMMKARSSIGRSNFEVCSCAGWGDVGYINRWTMEIRNNHAIPAYLIVRERVSQLAFFEVSPLEEDYSDTGKYQTSNDLDVIKATWSANMMLPQLWKDRA